MRRAAAFAVLLGAGLLTGHALADGLPLPPLPSVTSVTSLPSVPSLPSVTSVPSLPATTVQTTSVAGTLPTTPGLSSPTPSAPVGSAGSTTAAGAVTPFATGPSAQPGPNSFGGDLSGPRATRGHSSRTWISTTGPKRRRTTILTFVLPRAARVAFVVKQVAPVCRLAARFTVAGHRGVNRVRFPRRPGRLTFDPGTYRISGRTRSGRLVQRVIVVVVDGGPPGAAELEAARAADACAAPGSLASFGSGSTFAQVERPSSPGGAPSASGPVLRPGSLPGGVLGSSVTEAARTIRPLLVALLASAIVLFGIASLPRVAFVDRRANELLARHRLEIASLGAAAFIAVVITFLLG